MPSPPRFVDLGVVRRDRRRHHDHVDVADVRGIVAVPHADAERRQPIGDVGALRVGSGHVVAEVCEQFGDPAHADAANADEMNPPCAAQHSIG